VNIFVSFWEWDRVDVRGEGLGAQSQNPHPFKIRPSCLRARREAAPASQTRQAQCSAKSPPKGKFVRGVLLCRGYPSRAQGKKPRPTKLRAAGRTEGLGARRLNPHPLQKGKTQRMRHPQSRIAARLKCGVRRKAEPPAFRRMVRTGAGEPSDSYRPTITKPNAIKHPATAMQAKPNPTLVTVAATPRAMSNGEPISSFSTRPVVSRRFNRSCVRNARNQSATNKNIPQPNQRNDKNPNLLQNFNKIKAQTTISMKKIKLTARK